MKLRIYVGYDVREDIAWRVCEHSIITRTNSEKIEIKALVQQELREQGVYWRPIDKLASTEFSLTRFLVPSLAGFEGFAIFVDCDFLFLSDIQSVLNEIDITKAVSVVQHDYRPSEVIKMDGQTQQQYPRKNWSSFMVFNCAHPANKKLTTQLANEAEPSFLHRFQWLKDSEIGVLDIGWNYLAGWYPPQYEHLHAIHYTSGGPWFPHMQTCDFANVWLQEQALLPRD